MQEMSPNADAGKTVNPQDQPQPDAEQQARMAAEEQMQEQKLIRRLQLMMNLVMQTIAQDGSLTLEDACIGRRPGARALARIGFR